MAAMMAAAMYLASALLGGIAWAANRRRLRPGSALGIRTPATMRSEDAWHSAQAAGAPWFRRAAITMAVSGAVLLLIGGYGAPPALLNICALPCYGLTMFLVVKAVRAALADAAIQRH